MKMKINAREITPGCKVEIVDKGDWIDLHAAEDVELNAPQAGTQYEKDGSKFRDVTFSSAKVHLGIAVALPQGYEAQIVPRSSSFKNFNIIQSNSPGIIDFTYRGTYDEWGLPIVALGHVSIKKGDRICQFRIQLSQKATIWQKIKWLFTSKIKFNWVSELDDISRGGFGTTGK